MTGARIESQVFRWALEWRGAGGKHFIWEDMRPLLFVTKREAIKYAVAEYGFIRTRNDLRSPPHNWRMPRPVRVEVVLKQAEKVNK